VITGIVAPIQPTVRRLRYHRPMNDDRIVRECRAALAAAIEGSLGLIKVGRQLLERMESGDPLSPAAIAEYRSHFDGTEEQLRMLEAVLEQWLLLASTPTRPH
jgi:hypothetical protein